MRCKRDCECAGTPADFGIKSVSDTCQSKIILISLQNAVRVLFQDKMLPEGSGLQYARLSWNDVKHISLGTTLMQHK